MRVSAEYREGITPYKHDRTGKHVLWAGCAIQGDCPCGHLALAWRGSGNASGQHGNSQVFPGKRAAPSSDLLWPGRRWPPRDSQVSLEKVVVSVLIESVAANTPLGGGFAHVSD